MKTRLTLALLASSLYVAAALAGPGSQYWNRPRTPASVQQPGAPKPAETPSPKCDGCQTTPIRSVEHRGPAGKSVGFRSSGYVHSCSGCTGTNTVQNGQASTGMNHSANCATLVCCK